ncbi:MAG: hypothetical protein KAT91_03955, partial [Candidatus Aenigmarchaeota archaeon]|nr:hypothetical protein [Candidatus Aenigmarchaeota archaeon]
MGDLEHMIKNGATSFHCSVEHWSNPILLETIKNKKDFNEIRTGWDLIFDIDADSGLTHAQEAAILVVQALKIHGVENISVKFSGRRGFHIGVSSKSFPDEVNYVPTAALYPELLQKIAGYLREFLKDKLKDKLLEIEPELKEKMKDKKGDLDPYRVLDIEHNWSNRHLFRMPYSFNEKTGLVSIPIEPSKLKRFDMESAKPENVKADITFLDKYKKDEAMDLVMEALDWSQKQEDEKRKMDFARNERLKKDFKGPTEAIPEEFFPPCIHNIFGGLKDGRKRALFVLINFLRSSGWNAAQIEAKLWEWNKKNPEELSETIIKGQLDYSIRRSEVFPPPNCDNEGYYKDILVCTPDSFCSRFKNPVSYAAARYKNAKMCEKGKKKTKKKETPKKNKKEEKIKKNELTDAKIIEKPIK